jgi:hypothetical protein
VTAVLLYGCSSNDCKPNIQQICMQDVVYWIDSCGNQGDKVEDCACGCNAAHTACIQPDCTGRCCGDDGCGGTCTDECAANDQVCNNTTCLCEGTCVPNCVGKECGPDGCGNDCGPCGANFECVGGACACANRCDEACCTAGQICRLDCQDYAACDIFSSGTSCGADEPCTFIRDAFGRVTQTPCADSGTVCNRASECQGICKTDCQPYRGNPCDPGTSTAHCAEFVECIWIKDDVGNAVQTPASGYCAVMSCPFLFLWTGGAWEYYTDLAGSVLAYGNALIQSQYYYGGIYKLGDFAADNGVYRMKVRETIHEADYFDQVELVLADVPDGYEVYSRWSFTSQLGFTSPEDLVSVHNPRAPVSALDAQGNDVLQAVAGRDESPLPITAIQISTVVVDFGPIQHPEHAKLVMTAWTHFQDLRGMQFPPFVAGTTIETQDQNGEWVVRLVWGRNPGDRRSWVIDIAGIPSQDDTRMRITMAHTPWSLDVLDQVLLDDSPPVAFTVTRVKPRLADLHFAGSTNYTYSSLGQPIRSDDANNPILVDAVMYGDYTRYGDVRILLDALDDRFVVMAHGDELTLEFDAPQQNPGTTRRAFLDADVFYTIKYSFDGPYTDSIDPIPYHGMPAYPYDPAGWPYQNDPDYQNYLDTFNTRTIARE